jgi:hypothetical protein
MLLEDKVRRLDPGPCPSNTHGYLNCAVRRPPPAPGVRWRGHFDGGRGAVGAVVRESDIKAWGASAGLPSCTVYDNDAEAPRLFILR